MELEKEQYALIIPSGHIEFWKFSDKEFHKELSWKENKEKEFKASLQEAKEYAKKYNLKFLFPNKEFEKKFNS